MPARRVLGPVGDEAARKLESMMAPPEQEERALRAIGRERLPSADQPGLEGAIRYAKSLTSLAAEGHATRLYLSHPLRVAGLALDLAAEPSLFHGTLGVLHNAYEVYGLDRRALEEAGFSARIAEAVEALTVDRRRESDEDYLTEYYRRVEALGPEVALVRCVDKLDNLLGLEVYDGAKRASYLALADRFVTPIASRLSVELGRFFAEVVAYMVRVGCRSDLKTRYDRYVAAQGDRS